MTHFVTVRVEITLDLVLRFLTETATADDLADVCGLASHELATRYRRAVRVVQTAVQTVSAHSCIACGVEMNGGDECARCFSRPRLTPPAKQ